MVCTSYGNVIVCGPPRGVYRRLESHKCHACETHHPFVETWDGAWYGVTLYGACGDAWQDGYRRERPFLRYWRRDAQAYFQRLWDNAAPADLYDAYTRADVEMACGNDAEIDQAIDKRRAAHDAILAYHAEKEN